MMSIDAVVLEISVGDGQVAVVVSTVLRKLDLDAHQHPVRR
jgi:hypothetical protein